MNFIGILKIITLVSNIGASIATVQQQNPEAPGAEKKENVRLMVSNAIQSSELVVGRDILDEKRFWRGIDKTVDGLVDVLKSSALAS